MDQRMIKTRKALYSALGRLLKDREFERISVSDITNEAGITRKTFYNHFQDKIDMVQAYQKELSEELVGRVMGHDKINREFFEDVLTLLGQQDELLTMLLSINGSPAVQEIMKGTMQQYCLRMMPDGEDKIFMEYQSVLMANAVFGIVQHWLTTGKRTSPEDTAEVISRLRFPISHSKTAGK